MFGSVTISRLREQVAAYVKGFDPALITAAQAVVVVDEAARIEKMAATLRSLAAARAADTDVLEREGDASPAHALARRTGTTVAKAAEALRTARRLRSQPALDAAARRGDVSPEQAAAISDAAAADPAAEGRLVERAKQASLAELRNDCDRIKAAADGDAEERHRRIHAARFARRRSCADGSGEIVYRSTRDEIAEAWSIISGFANQVFHQARQAGRREPAEAYAADGVLAMARAAARGAGARRGDRAQAPAGHRGGAPTEGAPTEGAPTAAGADSAGGARAPGNGAAQPPGGAAQPVGGGGISMTLARRDRPAGSGRRDPRRRRTPLRLATRPPPLPLVSRRRRPPRHRPRRPRLPRRRRHRRAPPGPRPPTPPHRLLGPLGPPLPRRRLHFPPLARWRPCRGSVRALYPGPRRGSPSHRSRWWGQVAARRRPAPRCPPRSWCEWTGPPCCEGGWPRARPVRSPA